MDPESLRQHLYSVYLCVYCEHEHAAITTLADGPWGCPAGGHHVLEQTLLALDQVYACLTALADYAATGHPASLAYCRSTFDHLLAVDAAHRQHVEAYLAQKVQARHYRRQQGFGLAMDVASLFG